MIFGVDMMRHDEAGVYNDRGLFEQVFDCIKFLEAGEGKEKFGGK
jgi:hypothetical protein